MATGILTKSHAAFLEAWCGGIGAVGWAEHVVWWQLYPLGFTGTPIRGPHGEPAHRLRRIADHLDGLIELGANGLLLGPVFASSTHGYDTLDHFRVDPRLGDEQDLHDLIAACHDRGIRVLLDGVFSHVGREHPDVQRALREGPGGGLASLFDIDWTADGGPRPRVFEGHDALVRLNHADPAAVDLTARALEHWLDAGIDGWRLDAAYSVPTAFWREVLGRARTRHPDAWFLAEVIHGDYAAFVAQSGVDSVTQYELWKAIRSSIADRNLFELDHALGRHDGFLETFVPNTFVGNHDVTRIASAVGADHAVVALAVLMTVGGIPSIYAGDERGATGVKEERIGGDDAVRPEAPTADPAPAEQRLVDAHRSLIALRRRHDWLTTARTEQLSLTNERYVYRATAPGGAHLEVEVDLSESRIAVRDARGTVEWVGPA